MGEEGWAAPMEMMICCMHCMARACTREVGGRPGPLVEWGVWDGGHAFML